MKHVGQLLWVGGLAIISILGNSSVAVFRPGPEGATDSDPTLSSTDLGSLIDHAQNNDIGAYFVATPAEALVLEADGWISSATGGTVGQCDLTDPDNVPDVDPFSQTITPVDECTTLPPGFLMYEALVPTSPTLYQSQKYITVSINYYLFVDDFEGGGGDGPDAKVWVIGYMNSHGEMRWPKECTPHNNDNGNCNINDQEYPVRSEGWGFVNIELFDKDGGNRGADDFADIYDGSGKQERATVRATKWYGYTGGTCAAGQTHGSNCYFIEWSGHDRAQLEVAAGP